MSVQDRKIRVHRLAWELANGPIPQGKILLHSCDNRICCNVQHLSVGTHADNALDRETKKRGPNSRKRECIRGHEFNDANTYITSSGNRQCRSCADLRREAWKRGMTVDGLAKERGL